MAETQKRTYVVLKLNLDDDKALIGYTELGRTEAYGPAEAPRQLREEQEAAKAKDVLKAGDYHVVNANSLHLVRLKVETKTTAQSSLLDEDGGEA